MRLHHRLKALERHSPDGQTGPTMIVINVVAPTPNGPGPADPIVAHILGSRTDPGCTVRRADDETADAFLARAEAERFRIHGPETYRPKEQQA